MVKNKKDMSDWLVVSDIDGTINNKARQLVQRNYDALHKFVDECGGSFTLASGRSPYSMEKHYKRLDIADGKAIVLNGAGIYDFALEKMIWADPLNEHCIEMIRNTVKKYPTISFQVISDEYVYIFRPTVSSRILAINAKLPIKYFYSFEAMPKNNWYKVIFTGLPPALKLVSKYIESMSHTTENLMFSSDWSYELVNEDTNKGKAALKLAEILGIDKSKTAAIGDYFNDYEMLKQVAFPACCGQAPKGMKEIAKLITCHCNNGAVADLLEYLMSSK